MADRSVGVKVTGARELRRAIKRAENTGLTAELKQAYREAERLIVGGARDRAPVQSGDLRASIRGTRSGAAATVVIGKGKTRDYAGVIIFPNNRGITPNDFPYRAIRDDWDRVYEAFEDAIDDVTKRI